MKRIFKLFLVTVILTSCVGENNSSNSVNMSSVANAITIDNTGILPVVGNAPTTSVVYVHNNNNTTINGIKFTFQYNNTQTQNSTLISKLKSLLGLATSPTIQSGGEVCSSIAALQSCPLSITTPAGSSQGSILITANYTANGQPMSFSNVVSYSNIPNNSNNGAIITSGVQLNSFGHSNGYGVVYVYGSGQNQVYQVNSLGTNKPAVTISQGNISGQEIQSNYVQAVEVSAPASVSGYTATLTILSSVGASNFVSAQGVGVTPTNSGAILTAGQVPLINSATVNPGGTLYVVNSGNESAVTGSATFSDGIVAAVDGCSSQTLVPGGSCTITFNVPESGGSGNISIPYSGGTVSSPLVQNVTWYNGTGGVVLQMTANPSPLIFNATVGASSIVTLTNIGGYSLTNLSVPSPVVISGSATAQIESDNCSGESLAIGASCNYTVALSDNATDISAQVNLYISGNYNNGTLQTYSRTLPLTYTSNTYSAVLAITPSPLSLITTGDNIQFESQLITISNNGATATTAFTLTGLSSQPGYLTSANNSCGAGLAVGESCTVVINLGPTASGSLESGTAVYTVTYSGGQASGATATDNINWTVYTPATVSAYLSSTSESLNQIEAVTQNTIFYLYYQLSGGYPGETFSYTPTYNGIPLTTCTLIYGSQTSCYIPVNSGSTGGSQPINFGSASGGITPSPATSSIIVAPTNVFFGTSAGTVYENTTLLPGQGPMVIPSNAPISSVVVANNTIYASAGNVGNGYVWMTSGGESWVVYGGAPVFGYDGNDTVNVLAASGNFIYAGTGNTASGNVWFASSLSSGWESVGNAQYPYGQNIKALAISGQNLYAGDDGGNVEVANITNPASATWESICNDSLYPNYVITSLQVNDDGSVFVGTTSGDVWQCPSGGIAWQNVGNPGGIIVYPVNSIAVYNGNLYAGLSNGTVWESMAGQWQSYCSDQIPDSNLASLIVNSTGVYAGTGVDGALGDVWYCSGINSTWVQESGSSLYGSLDFSLGPVLLAESAGVVYAGTVAGNVFAQTSLGGTWSGVVKGSLDGSIVFTTALYGNYSYAGTGNGNVWQYNGSIWSQLPGSGYQGSLDGSSVAYSSILSLASASGGTVYAGTSNGNVWMRYDGGSSVWSSLGSPDGSSVYSVATSGSDIYAGTENGNVFQYISGSWSNLGFQPDGSSINSIAASGSNVYVGKYNGNVWLSYAGGPWVLQSGSGTAGTLDDSPIDSLSLFGSNVYAGTFAGNVWLLTDGQWVQESGSGGLGSLDGSTVFSVAASGATIYAGTLFGNVWVESGNNQQWSTFFALPNFQINSISIAQ